MTSIHDEWRTNALCTICGALLSLALVCRAVVLYRELLGWSTGARKPTEPGCASSKPRGLLSGMTAISSGVASPASVTPSDSRAVFVAGSCHATSVITAATPSAMVVVREGLNATADDASPSIEAAAALNLGTRAPRGSRAHLRVAASTTADISLGGTTAASSESERRFVDARRSAAVDSDADDEADERCLLRGLEVCYTPATLKLLFNPVNTLTLAVAIVRASQAVLQLLAAVATLIGAPYSVTEVSCGGMPASTAETAAWFDRPPAWSNGTALPPLACDAIAVTVEFCDAAALTLMLCLIIVVASPTSSRLFLRTHFRRAYCFFFFASVAVGFALALGMWFALPHLPWGGTKFSASTSWCWIPSNREVAHAPGAPGRTKLELLRLGCSYAFAPLLAGACIVAFANLGAELTRVLEWRYKRRRQRLDASEHRAAVRRRFLPLALWYVVYFAGTGLSRVSEAYANAAAARATASFLYPADAAVQVLLWSYAEGVVRALLLGRRASTSMPTVDEQRAAIAAIARDLRAGLQPDADSVTHDAALPDALAAIPFSLAVNYAYSLNFRCIHEQKQERSRGDMDWFLSQNTRAALPARVDPEAVVEDTDTRASRGVAVRAGRHCGDLHAALMDDNQRGAATVASSSPLPQAPPGTGTVVTSGGAWSVQGIEYD